MARGRRPGRRNPKRQSRRRNPRGALIRRLRGWTRRALVALGSGWTIVTAGAAVGVVAVALLFDAAPPAPPAKTVVAEAPLSVPTPVPPPPPAPAPPPPAAAPAAIPAPPPPVAAPAAPAPQLAALPAPPAVVEPDTPAWLRNAVAVPDPGDRPVIAVVIDDVGLNRVNARRVIDLPPPLTLAFLTYADDLPQQAAAAHRAGHELLVHMAMEPTGAHIDPGPDVLRTHEPPGRLLEQLQHNLAVFDGYVGINNHMGSRFTASEPDMRLVLAELKRRGLLFLDSRTIGASVGGAVAAQLGLPFAERDVFLDNVQSADAVETQLAEVERIARTHGHAVAIGHPHDATIAALAKWLPTLHERGFALVPVSTIVKRRLGVTG